MLPKIVLSNEKHKKYTKPKINYKYEQVSWEMFMNDTGDYKTVRSSFIPYIKSFGEDYWILGSFHDHRDILTDFGGSCILFGSFKGIQRRNYQHAFGCAMLELNEESKGLLVKPVLASLGLNEIAIYRGIDELRKEYVWFVMVPLNYHVAKIAVDSFEVTPNISNELLGPINFYRYNDIINKKYRTSRNLTDFVNYLRTL